MAKYYINFQGRKARAIGVFHNCAFQCEANSLPEFWQKFYEGFELNHVNYVLVGGKEFDKTKLWEEEG